LFLYGRGKLKNTFLLIIAIFLTTIPIFADDNDEYLGGSTGIAGTEQQQGQTGQTSGTGTQTSQPDLGGVNTWDFLTMLVSLAVIVGIIYGIFYFVKKGVGKKIVENELITIVGSKIITGSKALHVIEVGKTMYLLGSSNESINLISEITDKETKDTLKLASTQKNQKPVRFQDFIANIFRRDTKKQLDVAESVDFMKQQRSRLKRMKEQ